MQITITLTQVEIEKAIREYVTNNGAAVEGKEIEISLAATRGAAGYTATVIVDPVQDKVAKPEKKTRRKRKAPGADTTPPDSTDASEPVAAKTEPTETVTETSDTTSGVTDVAEPTKATDEDKAPWKEEDEGETKAEEPAFNPAAKGKSLFAS